MTDTDPLPTDPEDLARLHEALCQQRHNLQAEIDRLSGRIREVCEARSFALFGVKAGTEIRLRDGTTHRVSHLVFFCNLKTRPIVAVGDRVLTADEYTVV